LNAKEGQETMEQHQDAAVLPTDEERRMLRESLRGFLEERWPVSGAVERAADPKQVSAIWRRLVDQGVAALGTEPSEGGLREIAIVMEELGRTACPAPMMGAYLLNLAHAPRAGSAGPLRELVGKLHAGDASIAFAFGSFDPDAGADNLEVLPGSVNGSLNFVEGADSCTHLVVAIGSGPGLAIVDLAQPGVSVTTTRALGAPGLCEVQLEEVPAEFVELPRSDITDLLLAARLGRVARAHGAARRAFELVVDYAKERHQFGQPIGRFQAIQHKLANCLIDLEGVRLTLDNAAAHHDRRIGHWRYFASAAAAFAGNALRRVSLETHHAFGAIGYAEEHEAPRHFKQVHLDMVALGGAAAARRAVAAELLDAHTKALPAYDLGEAGNAFRADVKRWLESHWTAERRAAFEQQSSDHLEYDAAFNRDLGTTGWIGLSWPREYGGQARSPLEQLAFIEEMERAEAPRTGAAIQANALMLFGTPEQQKRYLPEILCGEVMHGMGYSEPNAGSDLASLRTSATRDGDEWVINGQKIWTTTWWGKYMFLAARTDRDAKPMHAGISMFIVPMDAAGITINPAKTMYDGSFANIFYDNVRLPSDALVGELNGGWKVLTGALAFERGLIGGGIVMKVAHAFELLCQHITESRLADDVLVRDCVAGLASEIEVGRQLMMQCAELAVDGITPPEYGAMSKVFSGELMERFGEAALDILGMRAALSKGARGALAHGKFEQGLRHSLMWVISIGTNEIQRSLIAQKGLGLPR
jgi:alkylation response protein AidB-like acyl-CoA dehydrogenase